jgi:AbrB family looped-hinge helix DNA binding protein
MATRVTTKGQATIPKPVRQHLGIRPGSSVEFELTESGSVVLRVASRTGKGRRASSRVNRFEKLRGRATVRMRTEDILALTRGP